LAREYFDLNKPNWGVNTSRSSGNLIQAHLIRKLDARPIRELTDAELQRLVNGYVERGSTGSLLSKLTMYLRAILDVPLDRRLIERNPAAAIRAKIALLTDEAGEQGTARELSISTADSGDAFWTESQGSESTQAHMRQRIRT
jgi:hypothetical protein